LGVAAVAATLLSLALTGHRPWHAQDVSPRVARSAPPLRVEADTPAPVPVDAVRIQVQDVAQAVVDAHPEGTSFLIETGVHRGFEVRPRNRDTFYAEGGAVLDGTRTAPYAFYAYASHRDPGAHDVTIQGHAHGDRLLVRNYTANHQEQVGAIHPQMDTEPELGRARGWTVRWLEVADNWATGIITGDGMLIEGCSIHHNGQLGIGGTGSQSVVRGNEIAYNNTRGVNPKFEAGGAKWADVDGLVVEDNHVHHNHGPGLWTDIDSRGVVYRRNLIAYNDNEGILHEISHDAVILDNRLTGNGVIGDHSWLWGGGIVISSSENVEVSGNRLTDNGNGITGVQQDRGDGRHGPHLLQNLSVHGNTVLASGVSGIAQDVHDRGVFARHLAYAGNTYLHSGLFAWEGGLWSWNRWQGFHQDALGTWS
jgi:hypothetical protein